MGCCVSSAFSHPDKRVILSSTRCKSAILAIGSKLVPDKPARMFWVQGDAQRILKHLLWDEYDVAYAEKRTMQPCNVFLPRDPGDPCAKQTEQSDFLIR